MKEQAVEWQAMWIWGDGGPTKNQYRLFKKDFQSVEERKETKLYITADSRYVLYLNGRRLGQGPVRSWPFDQKYDVYDITGKIEPGTNTIAVMVHFLGISTFQYIAGRGGLLCQVETESPAGQSVLAKTDASWKTKVHPAYAHQVPRICCQLGYEEQFDAGRDLLSGGLHWHSCGFSAVDWDGAEEIGAVGMKPWTHLSPRDIPFLTEEPVYPKGVVSLRTVEPLQRAYHVDLLPLYRPKKVDANREMLAGALVMNIHAEVSCQLTWHRFGVYGFGGRVLINGNTVEFDSAMSTSVPLQPGDNLVIVDLSGQWHDMVYPFGFSASDSVQLQPLSGRGSACLLYLPEEAAHENLPRLLAIQNTADLEEDASLLQSLRPVPEESVMDNIFAKTSRATPINGCYQGVQDLENLTAASPADTVVYPAADGGDVELLLDFGREIAGFLQFRVSAEENTVLDWNCFEGVQEGRWLFTENLNNTLRYTTRRGCQSFHSHVRRGFRYCLVTIGNLKQPLYIEEIRCLLNTYPVRSAPDFQCSDYLLNSIWQMCKYTSRLCSEDTYVDCPAYEQAFWVGDARNEALIDYYVNGDYRLAKRSLSLVASSLQRSPLPESQVPSGWQDILTAWSLLWLLACRELYQFSGDGALLRELYPSLRRTCRTFVDQYLNEQGLLEIEAWNMLDWAGMDTPNTGIVTHQNAWLVKALRETAQLALDLDTETAAEDSRHFRRHADSLQQAMNEHLWSEREQAFVDCIHEDGTPSHIISQQTNTVVYLCDCVTGRRRELLCGYVRQVPDTWVSIGSPFMMFFSLEALAKDGQYDLMVEWMRRYWGMMLDRGATSCWETFPGFQQDRWTRSHCHAWSAAPGYFLPMYQLGVRPLKTGFAEVLIEPETVDLQWCRGTVPTPHGDLRVQWEYALGFTLSVELPPATSGTLVLPPDVADANVIEGQAQWSRVDSGRLQAKAAGGQRIRISGIVE